jgi:hypothetical protein
MTLIFDGPPGTKLGEGETDGMHELLADDDLPTYELPDEPDEDELEELKKAAGPTLSAAEAAERKVAGRIYAALRAATSAAEAIVSAAHSAQSPDAAASGLRHSGMVRLYGLAARPAVAGYGGRRTGRDRRRRRAGEGRQPD